MKPVKVVKVVVLGILLLATWENRCFASQEPVFSEVLKDAVIGGISGSLVGAAVMAFTGNPSRHLDYVVHGAAGGVVAGGIYGLFNARGSLVEVKEGKVSFDVPVIFPDVRESGAKGTNVVLTADLISGEF